MKLHVWVGILGVSTGALTALMAGAQSGAAERRLGFTREALAAERTAEAQFVAGISTSSISDGIEP